MPKQLAKEVVPQRRSDPEDNRWSRIGIDAVAAASIYTDHGDEQRKSWRRSKNRQAATRYTDPDFATD